MGKFPSRGCGTGKLWSASGISARYKVMSPPVRSKVRLAESPNRALLGSQAVLPSRVSCSSLQCVGRGQGRGSDVDLCGGSAPVRPALMVKLMVNPCAVRLRSQHHQIVNEGLHTRFRALSTPERVSADWYLLEGCCAHSVRGLMLSKLTRYLKLTCWGASGQIRGAPQQVQPLD